jgi:hypothetical protein
MNSCFVIENLIFLILCNSLRWILNLQIVLLQIENLFLLSTFLIDGLVAHFILVRCSFPCCFISSYKCTSVTSSTAGNVCDQHDIISWWLYDKCGLMCTESQSTVLGKKVSSLLVKHHKDSGTQEPPLMKIVST